MTGTSKGIIASLSHMPQLRTLIVMLVLVAFLTACYGPFPLTWIIYKFNGAIPTGIFQSLVFWLFLIVPVYEVALTVDIIVLNLIEFWFPGEQFDNPLAEEKDGQKVTFTASENGREGLLTVSEMDRVLLELQFVKVSDTLCEVLDVHGKLLGTAHLTAAGNLELTDGDGRLVRTVSAAEISSKLSF